MIEETKMPRAGNDSRARAKAHLQWAERYNQQGQTHKALSHFGRALEYDNEARKQEFGIPEEMIDMTGLNTVRYAANTATAATAAIAAGTAYAAKKAYSSLFPGEQKEQGLTVLKPSEKQEPAPAGLPGFTVGNSSTHTDRLPASAHVVNHDEWREGAEFELIKGADAAATPPSEKRVYRAAIMPSEHPSPPGRSMQLSAAPTPLTLAAPKHPVTATTNAVATVPTPTYNTRAAVMPSETNATATVVPIETNATATVLATETNATVQHADAHKTTPDKEAKLRASLEIAARGMKQSLKTRLTDLAYQCIRAYEELDKAKGSWWPGYENTTRQNIKALEEKINGLLATGKETTSERSVPDDHSREYEQDLSAKGLPALHIAHYGKLKSILSTYDTIAGAKYYLSLLVQALG